LSGLQVELLIRFSLEFAEVVRHICDGKTCDGFVWDWLEVRLLNMYDDDDYGKREKRVGLRMFDIFSKISLF
jgi:hypothetical protein